MKKFWLPLVLSVGTLAIVGVSGCTAVPGIIAPKLAGNTTVATAETSSTIITSQESGIAVSGTGIVSVTPDVANISLGVRAQDTTVSAAQAEAATAMAKIMAVLKSNNIADKDIQTTQFNINPVYNYNSKTSQNNITGYSVTNVVSVKVRVIANAGKVIDAVAAAGGDLTVINSISFSVDDSSQYYVQARQLAMADAKAKATQLATLGGVTLGKPVYITDTTYTPSTQVAYDTRTSSGVAATPSTTISAGDTNITINVQVVYAIS